MHAIHRDIRRAVWLVALGWAGLNPAPVIGGEGRSGGVETPPYEDFLVVPLRIHILSATGLPDIDCGLTDADVARIVGKLNGVWRPAGIHWGLEATIHEPAARQDEFKRQSDKGVVPLGVYASLAPESSKSKTGLHVYYIHKFSVNGVYLGGSTAFVQETAKLRAVEGGIDEPLPRVTAHELGHALGLPHRQDRTNLLASGTTGTTLNAAEVVRARSFARKTPGVRTVAELRQASDAATKAGDLAEVRRLRSLLAAIPGEPAQP